MKVTRKYTLTVLLMGFLCLVGCKPEKEYIYPEVVVTMDPLADYEEEPGKIALYHNEQWLKWESGDKIRIYSIKSGKYQGFGNFSCERTNGARVAYMHAEGGLPLGDKFFAVTPPDMGYDSYTDQQSLGVDGFKIVLPDERKYRKNTSAASYADSSFGPDNLPMVSYQEGTSFDMQCHMVAGIMRLQFWNEDATEYSVNYLALQSVNIPDDGIDDAYPTQTKALSGVFDVCRLIYPNPYLAVNMKPVGSDDTKVKYTFDQDDPKRILSSGSNGQLWTLYIPLPAQCVDRDHQVCNYKMYMTLALEDNSHNKKYLKKGIKIDIKRQCITMMPAIGFNNSDLDDTPDLGSFAGHVSIGLVGNGTPQRPYRIYTARELDTVRRAFKAASTAGTDPVINGQKVTPSTCFEIVRSDIHLLTVEQRDSIYTANGNYDTAHDNRIVVWTEGIIGFKGRMSIVNASTNSGVIINSSEAPLFQSISEDGVIERIQIRGRSTYTGTGTFSPLCYENKGKMIDCHVKDTISCTHGGNLAGLCVVNGKTGEITGGANEAPLTTTGNVCGCVYTNYGKVQGSFSLSAAIPQGANIAGICYDNYGTLQYCQVESNINPMSTGNWGVVAFHNHAATTIGTDNYPAATIDRCISSGTVVFSTTGSIGGICNINDGIVKNCSNKVTLRGASGDVGGIVATMNSGEVYNCDAVGGHWIDGTGGATLGHVAQNAGGIVGYLKGGTISNCWCRCRVDGATSSGGIVGNVDIGSQIRNAWSAYGHNFIGASSATGVPLSIGANCFSAHLTDISRGCCTIDTAGGVYTIHEMYNDATSTLVGEYLYVALNNWVTSNPTSSADNGDYVYWTTTAVPNLIFPTSISKGRKRK